MSTVHPTLVYFFIWTNAQDPGDQCFLGPTSLCSLPACPASFDGNRRLPHIVTHWISSRTYEAEASEPAFKVFSLFSTCVVLQKDGQNNASQIREQRLLNNILLSAGPRSFSWIGASVTFYVAFLRKDPIYLFIFLNRFDLKPTSLEDLTCFGEG